MSERDAHSRPAPAEDQVERVARAICLQRNVDPDGCASGQGWINSNGDSGFTCHTRNWQSFAGDARAALSATLPGEGELAPVGWRDSVRPEVAAFALLMERELRANDHKTGWKGVDRLRLARHMRQEADELCDLLHEHKKSGIDQKAMRYSADDTVQDAVAEEAADVANMALMVADVCGCLSTAPSPPARETAPSDSEMVAALEKVRQQIDDFSLDVNCNCDHIFETIDAALSNRPATGRAVDAEGMRERAAKVAESTGQCMFTKTYPATVADRIAAKIRSLPLATEGE